MFSVFFIVYLLLKQDFNGEMLWVLLFKVKSKLLFLIKYK